MNRIVIGSFVIILGFCFTAFFGSIFGGGSTEYSYLSGIIFAVLYLAGVVSVCTSSIIRELKEIKK